MDMIDQSEFPAAGALGIAEEQAEEMRRRGDVCVHAIIGIRVHAFKGVDGVHGDAAKHDTPRDGR